MKLLLRLVLWLGVSGLLCSQPSLAQDVAPTGKAAVVETDQYHSVEELWAKGRFAEAIPSAKELVAKTEARFGANHTNTAMALFILAKLFEKVSGYTNSVALHARALEIREKLLEPEHLDIALSLDNLAVLYLETGDYVKAKPLFERNLMILQKVWGPEHPETATALNNLGSFYSKIGDHAKAEPLFERSLDICEKVLGLEHPHTAAALVNLAELYQSMCDYTKARTLFERSLKVHEKIHGLEHPETAKALSYLGMLYLRVGDYAKAQPKFEQSLRINKQVLGPEHPETATSLNNLAVFYFNIGDYAKAEPLHEQSLRIREKLFGPDHPETAQALNNLAVLCQSMGDYAKARSYLEQSLKTHERIFGPEHPETATSLNNLAELWRWVGNYSNAEPLHRRALMIREKALGPEHPETATSLDNLAWLYRWMGDYEKAEPLAERSLKIYQKSFGPEHPETATALNNLSHLQLVLGKVEDSLASGRKCRAAWEAALGNILTFASERQRLSCQASTTFGSVGTLATLGSAVDLAEFALRTKGMVLDSLMEDALGARTANDPAIRRPLEELRTAGLRLTKLQIEASGATSETGHSKLRAEQEHLEQRIESLQKSLAQNVTSLGQVRRALRVTVPDVQRVLADDTVLLEFIRYLHYLGRNTFETRYGAVVVGHESVALKDAKVGEPVWIPLATEAAIERIRQDYAAIMRGEKKGDPMVLGSLGAQLFEPIQRRLPKGITSLIISADSQLNFISFATLLDPQDRFVAERYSIRYVASGRDLLFEPTSQNRSRSYAAFADPAFAARPTAPGSKVANDVQPTMQSADRRDYGGIRLGALPNTSLEAQFLQERSNVWRVEGAVHVGAEASESEVKAVKSPYILHLATHGFFLPDSSPTNRPPIQTRLIAEQHSPVVLRNPMQRSGLAFAGAQLTLDAWKRGEVPDTENDGILTAQEVGTMDLKDTWLVVLSACDTGIGEARNGEGVMGLRRGFVQAGAQNLLMTLWPISDKWSVEIMKAFYEKAMVSGDAPQAMADVQAEWLAKLRKEKGVLIAARIAGPFVLSTRGRQSSK